MSATSSIQIPAEIRELAGQLIASQVSTPDGKVHVKEDRFWALMTALGCPPFDHEAAIRRQEAEDICPTCNGPMNVSDYGPPCDEDGCASEKDRDDA